MYKMTYDSSTLLDMRVKDYALRDANCHLEVNDAGHLDFKIDAVHPLYGLLQYMSKIVELKLDDDVLYRGRITKMIPNDQDLSYAVETEGQLAYLNDSIAPAFKYPDDFLSNPDYQEAVEQYKVVEFILNYIIAAHNNSVADLQKVHLGTVGVGAFDNHLSVTSSGTDTTYTVIKSILGSAEAKCYMMPRYETGLSNNGLYVDFYDDFSLFGTNDQEIKYKDNLLSITDERDATNTCSLIVPIGKDDLAITSLPDGVLQGSLLDYSLDNDCIVKEGNCVYSKAKRDLFGIIKKNVTLDYVTEVAFLKDYALSILLEGVAERKITVTALDKHFTQGDSPFLVGRNTHVKHKLLGIDAAFPLTSQDIDILMPTNTKNTLGGTIKNANIF